ncbi:hypothetical protein SAMN05421640_0094 [Ekhidna lutea]|uniref:Lacal_2735 family protein n=1 Tax=Ekhidna lutea TaxID=447679 RepID=A0A239EFS6_EKHLU|nr:Lacal_2735 family protein [Ekhidna lutea]SNS42752.1 hypothetical protein SAMN05421640_0094 [Ekhidna lutea]
MLNFFRKPRIESLRRQYDSLMHEAYILAKSNPEQSMKKQQEAIDLQRQILDKIDKGRL